MLTFTLISTTEAYIISRSVLEVETLIRGMDTHGHHQYQSRSKERPENPIHRRQSGSVIRLMYELLCAGRMQMDSNLIEVTSH